MKTNLLKSWLMLVMLLLGVGTMWAEKITDYTNIVSGKKYYIGATTGTTDYYLSVDGSTTSTSIAGTAVDDKTNGTVFVFEGSGTSWTIKFDGTSNYLGLKSSKDNGKVQVVSSAATFTASNQSGKLRLTIGSYSIQKNNSGTQFGSYANTQTDIWLEEASSSTPVTKYNVTIANNIANGTVKANYSTAAEGTTVTLTATPATGYELNSWNVTDASSNAITVTNNQFTMPAADVNVSATFVPEPTNIVFDLTTDNTTTATTTEMSWVATQVSIVAKKGKSTTDTNNYYPGTSGKTYSSTRFYTNSTLTFTPASGVSIIKIVYTATSASYATALQSSTWTNASAAVDGTIVTITPTDGTQAVSATIGANTGASSIKVFFSGEAAPTTATITLNAACTDGDFVYGTYSNTSNWIVPSDLVVSEVCVLDGELAIYSYDEGDVVPANAGVMIAAEAGDDYTIDLTSDAATDSPSGGENSLVGTGDGITAAEMAQANTEFFRLTMHNGKTIGFFWGAENGAAFDLGANKAYLAVATDNLGVVEAKAPRLWFGEDNEDAIKAVKADSNEVIYNLAGQRINKMQKGINIVNGKKILK